jgi:hypothetical protein
MSNMHVRYFHIRRSKTWQRVICASAVSLGLAAFIPTVAIADSNSPSTAVVGAAPGDPFGMAPVNIANALSSQYPNQFGGVVEDQTNDVIDVYVTSVTPSIESVGNSTADSQSVDYLTTSHSMSSMLSEQQQVIADLPSLKSSGIDVSVVTPIIQTGLLQIGVLSASTSAISTLDNDFGASNISVYTAPYVSLTVSRNDDASPWNGGDAQADSSGDEGCTNGVPVTNPSTNVVYTMGAAHCWADGTDIYNKLCPTPSTCVGDGNLEGSVTSRDEAGGGTDTSLQSLDTTGVDDIITGAIGSPVSSSWGGSVNNTVGSTICNDGAYSGEVCGTVSTVNNCVVEGGRSGSGTACDLEHATSSGIMNQAGDSGGPVLRTISGVLYAAGIVSASTSSDTTTCAHNTTTCYKDLYYTDMTAADGEWGVNPG